MLTGNWNTQPLVFRAWITFTTTRRGITGIRHQLPVLNNALGRRFVLRFHMHRSQTQ
jgi:hypothetical protein